MLARLRSVARARVLRVVLVLGMVPVVVFANPTTATAVTNVSQGVNVLPNTPWARVDLNLGGFPDVTCRTSVRYLGMGEALQFGPGECSGGPDTTPGWVQLGEPGTYYAWDAEGLTGDNEVCMGMASGQLADHPDDGWTTWGTIDPGELPLSRTGCQVQELCLTLFSDDGFGESEAEDCVDLSGLVWGDEPIGPTQCEYFEDPQVTKLALRSSGTNLWSVDVEFSAKLVKDQTGVNFDWYWIVDNNGVREVRFFNTNGAWWEPNIVGQTVTKKRAYEQIWYKDQSNVDFVGAGVYGRGMDGGPATPDYPQNDANGIVGMTDPERCAFYWGDKVAIDNSSDQDEPAGPLPGDEEPEDPHAEPPPLPVDDNDPVDEPSFWGQILALLAGIAAAIWAIPNLILNGLRALLTELFVPSEAFLNGQLNGLKDAWANTPPMVFLGAVNDLGSWFNMTGPAGCQGPALTIDNQFTGSQTLHPLSACGEEVALVASIVKTGLTVIVYVGAALASVRIIGSAFGLDLQLSKGSDDA